MLHAILALILLGPAAWAAPGQTPVAKPLGASAPLVAELVAAPVWTRVALSYRTAADARSLVAELLDPSPEMEIDRESNSLIVRGRPDLVASAVRLAEALDQKTPMAQLELRMISFTRGNEGLLETWVKAGGWTDEALREADGEGRLEILSARSITTVLGVGAEMKEGTCALVGTPEEPACEGGTAPQAWTWLAVLPEAVGSGLVLVDATVSWGKGKARALRSIQGALPWGGQVAIPLGDGAPWALLTVNRP